VALAAVVVGEEREAAVVECLEQHDTGGGNAIGRAGGEDHCIGFVELRHERLIEPLPEERERIISGLGF
jgi:hypothetical protein